MDPLISQVTNPCPATLAGTSAQMFLTLINVLMGAQCGLKSPVIEDYSPQIVDMDIFDFVVIGAGSAGSVVANRLSEIKDWDVLVLEAGGDPSVTSQIPALLFSLQDTEESWVHSPEEQKSSCQGMKRKRCNWPTGRALGGSSSINAMLYVRGNRMDYDNWEAQGNPGWGWDEVMKYFKKSEDNLEFPDNPEYHGTGGYLKVNNYDFNVKVQETVFKAAEELGIPTVKDIHNGKDICFGTGQGTVHEGTRFSTYEAFLYSVKDRQNLKVAKNAQVTRVHINPKTMKAEAVELKIIEKNEIKRVRVRKEVIISAGALRTPQILMLSGVGPKEHLEEMEIPVKQDLKVGHNLQDHIFHLGFYITVAEEIAKVPQLADELYKYFMHREGLFGSVGLTNTVGFVNTLNDSSYPDIQYLHLFFDKNDPYGLPVFIEKTRVEDKIAQVAIEANKKTALLQLATVLLRPKSRGQVKLRSSHPFEDPIFISNYLTEDEDVETILRGIKFAMKLLETEAFKPYKPEIVNLNITGCSQYEFKSDDYWRCNIKHLATTVYHYSGTAKMGPDSDPDAVVDSRLRVRGIKNLRVIDASIMPNLVSANTNAPCIMIGEKGADLIKEDHEVLEKSKKDEL